MIVPIVTSVSVWSQRGQNPVNPSVLLYSLNLKNDGKKTLIWLNLDYILKIASQIRTIIGDCGINKLIQTKVTLKGLC